MWKALLLYLLTYSSATTPTISALMNPHVCEFSLHDRPGVEIATSRRATLAIGNQSSLPQSCSSPDGSAAERSQAEP